MKSPEMPARRDGACSTARFSKNRVTGKVPILEIPERDEQGPAVVPLKRTELHGQVVGPLASLRLTLSFGYAGAASARAICRASAMK